MTRPGSSTITWGIIGLWSGSVYSAMSRSFWIVRRTSERKGQCAPMPVRYSFVSVMLSVLILNKSAIADLELAIGGAAKIAAPGVEAREREPLRLSGDDLRLER